MYKLQDLMQQEMTRKQFLITVGLALVTILGFSNVLKLLGKDITLHTTGAITASPSSSYGLSTRK